MPPRVSVVMTVYNGERYLAEAIASVLGQTYADFELIIVDDGSTDGSARIIEEYAERDSRIQFIPLSQNEGKASACNYGIEAAGGHYIAAMDHDDICLPDRLRKQTNYLDAHPRIGVIGGNIQVVDQDLKFRFESKLPLEHALIAWGLFFSPSIPGTLAMARRDLLMAVGGYRSGHWTVEDTELWSRLIAETRFTNLPDILMLYRRHRGSTTIADKGLWRSAGVALRKLMLERLWGEAPEITLDLFKRAWRREKIMRRAERKLLRAEMMRLIDSFLEAGWAEADERPLLLEAMEQRLLQIRPRRRHFWKYLR